MKTTNAVLGPIFVLGDKNQLSLFMPETSAEQLIQDRRDLKPDEFNAKYATDENLVATVDKNLVIDAKRPLPKLAFDAISAFIDTIPCLRCSYEQPQTEE